MLDMLRSVKGILMTSEVILLALNVIRQSLTVVQHGQGLAVVLCGQMGK